MHHARLKSMTSDDQDHDHDHDYSEVSSNEASQEHGSPAKRRRVSQSWVNVSCQLCKTRKVKCDRTLPSCGWCTRNNATCEYKERKKPGLRAGYGRELEQRLDKLEGILLQHSEVLARVVGGRVPPLEENQWNANQTQRQPAEHASDLPRCPPQTSDSTFFMNGLYESSQTRRESIGNRYSINHNHREFAPALPPISTTTSSHDRRPSVTFMNNPTSPPTSQMKPSQSPPAFTQGVLKYSTTSPKYAPLLTPNTTTSSGAHSPQHDYLSPNKHRIEHATTPHSTAQSFRERYPFNLSFSSYTMDPLPPWLVMYELAVLYFANINSVFPLLSEDIVFEVLLNPPRLQSEDFHQSDLRAILMAIVVVAMRFLPPGGLAERERNHYIRRAREELAVPGRQKAQDGVKALAVLLLGSNGELGSEETQDILGQVNDRLWKGENDERSSKPQSPMSVNKMLCRS